MPIPLGLTDGGVEEGLFVWSDGTRPGYLNWQEGQPDNQEYLYNCVATKGVLIHIDLFKNQDDDPIFYVVSVGGGKAPPVVGPKTWNGWPLTTRPCVK